MLKPRLVAFVLLFLALMSVSAQAVARPVRRLFEPTDLQLEEPGISQVDLQLGLLRGRGPYRLSVPDFEMDLGISRNLEIDLDGAVAIEGSQDGAFSFGRLAPDNLWTSAKIGLLDFRDQATGTAWAFGLQGGPKLPTARGSRGVGAEGLLLGALLLGRTSLVLNMGGLIDPGSDDGGTRARGFEGGFDLSKTLDSAAQWTLTAEVGGVYFRSDDLHQLAGTVGLSWAPNDLVELSLVGLAGFLQGSDRYGFLLGVSRKLRIWH